MSKGRDDKHSEQVSFTVLEQNCDNTSSEKQRLIKSVEETSEVLQAGIGKYISEGLPSTQGFRWQR